MIQMNASIGVPFERFFEENAGLIDYVCNKAESMSNRTIEEYEDIYQMACEGFIKAYKNFDGSKNNKFSTYAVPTMYGYILNYFSEHSGAIKFPRHYAVIWRTAKENELDGNNLHEIAKIVKKPVGQVANAMKWYGKDIPVSMNTPITIDEEKRFIEDLLGEDGDFSNCEVMEFLNVLTEKEQEIMLYKLTGFKNCEIAERMNTTAQAVNKTVTRVRNKWGKYFKGE